MIRHFAALVVVLLTCPALMGQRLVHVSNIRQDRVWLQNKYTINGVPIAESGEEFEGKEPPSGYWGREFGTTHLVLSKSLPNGTVGLAGGSFEIVSTIPNSILPGWTLGTQATAVSRCFGKGGQIAENKIAGKSFLRRYVMVIDGPANGSVVHFKVQFLLLEPSNNPDINLDIYYGASGGDDNVARATWDSDKRKWRFTGTRRLFGQNIVPINESHPSDPLGLDVIFEFDMHKKVQNGEFIPLQAWCNWYNRNGYKSHGQTAKSRGVALIEGGHVGVVSLTYVGVSPAGH